METKAMFDSQRIAFSITPTDAKGNPSSVEEGSLVGVADTDIGVSVSINEDGASGFIHSAAGSSGMTVVTLSADADLGVGVVTISQSYLIEVSHRLATNLGASIGEAEDEPTK